MLDPCESDAEEIVSTPTTPRSVPNVPALEGDSQEEEDENSDALINELVGPTVGAKKGWEWKEGSAEGFVVGTDATRARLSAHTHRPTHPRI